MRKYVEPEPHFLKAGPEENLEDYYQKSSRKKHNNPYNR